MGLKLSKALRYKIYKHALDAMLTCVAKTGNGSCSPTCNQLLYSCEKVTYIKTYSNDVDTAQTFPEFAELKPSNSYEGDLWWPAEDDLPRIAALKVCVEKTRPR
jgi:hypothetical protein